MVLGNWAATCLNNEIRTHPKPYTKINSKWIKDKYKLSNYKNYRNYKTLREKYKQNTLGVNHRKILHDPPLRAMEIETK